MRMPYESQTTLIPAQRHITQFLEFLGASDVAFNVDAALACSVRWRIHGEKDSLSMSALGYVNQWMRSRVWDRREPAVGQLGVDQERELAVINFWYCMRDEVLARAPVKIFNNARHFKSAEMQVHCLLQKLRRGDGV